MANITIDAWIELLADRSKSEDIGEYFHREKCAELLEFLKELKERRGKCEWVKYDYRTVCPKNHDIDNPYWRIPETRKDVLKYCPYCGKEIDYE